MTRPALLLLLATSALHATAVELPRVAPPGPGNPASPQKPAADSTKQSYDRRLNDGATPTGGGPSTGPASPSVIYPRTGGAETDTGVTLSGQSGALRDPQGGVWNCTAGGCFSPNGVFHPLRKPAPAAPAGR